MEKQMPLIWLSSENWGNTHSHISIFHRFNTVPSLFPSPTHPQLTPNPNPSLNLTLKPSLNPLPVVWSCGCPAKWPPIHSWNEKFAQYSKYEDAQKHIHPPSLLQPNEKSFNIIKSLLESSLMLLSSFYIFTTCKMLWMSNRNPRITQLPPAESEIVWRHPAKNSTSFCFLSLAAEAPSHQPPPSDSRSGAVWAAEVTLWLRLALIGNNNRN